MCQYFLCNFQLRSLTICKTIFLLVILWFGLFLFSAQRQRTFNQHTHSNTHIDAQTKTHKKRRIDILFLIPFFTFEDDFAFVTFKRTCLSGITSRARISVRLRVITEMLMLESGYLTFAHISEFLIFYS